MNLVLTATETRSRFFNVLNRVLYGGETVFISKAGTDLMVKMESVYPTNEVLTRLAGSVSDEDAGRMKKAIAKSKNCPKRPIASFE